jgi:ribosomal subunit interface protein
MSSHFAFHGTDEAVKARLEAYWARKLPRLQKVLVPYRHDLQDIELTVYHHPQNPQRAWYEARAVIHLPTGTLAAEDDDKDPEAAIDRVVDALVTEIKKHKERVRKDYVFKRKARRRADLSAAGPLLQRDADGRRRASFFRLLKPLLWVLRDHAARELRILELEGTLHRGEVTVADLLDEVLTLAWERFAERPRRLSLDLWLIDLLHETLEKLVKQEARPHASLKDKAGQADEQEWWARSWAMRTR